MVQLKHIAIGALLSGAVHQAHAETLQFSTDDSILIIRGRDSGPDAIYEFIGSDQYRIQCIALDESDTPIAGETSYSNMGTIRFSEISVDQIARVVCRRL